MDIKVINIKLFYNILFNIYFTIDSLQNFQYIIYQVTYMYIY
jgi:hypothetical protein